MDEVWIFKLHPLIARAYDVQFKRATSSWNPKERPTSSCNPKIDALLRPKAQMKAHKI